MSSDRWSVVSGQTEQVLDVFRHLANTVRSGLDEANLVACGVPGIGEGNHGGLPVHWPAVRMPDGMLVVDRAELMDLLRAVIARGERLGMDCDADYVEWLESLEEEDGLD